MSDFDFHIPHAGRVVKLTAPASQQLKLQGDGSIGINWDPEDKAAMQVEVRARVESTSVPVDEIPLIRWSSEVTHGHAVWTEPAQTQKELAQLVPSLDYALPGRGMVWRTSSRRFTITFRNAGELGTGDDIASSKLLVSILPVWGGLVDVYPYAHVSQNIPASNLQRNVFPMTAREWRLMTVLGRPVTAAAIDIQLSGVTGQPLPGGGSVDAADYSDWQPIPFDAAFWIPNGTVYAAYR